MCSMMHFFSVETEEKRGLELVTVYGSNEERQNLQEKKLHLNIFQGIIITCTVQWTLYFFVIGVSKIQYNLFINGSKTLREDSWNHGQRSKEIVSFSFPQNYSALFLVGTIGKTHPLNGAASAAAALDICRDLGQNHFLSGLLISAVMCQWSGATQHMEFDRKF